jgi:hypothetical protein
LRGILGAAAEHHGVELGLELVHRLRHADVLVVVEDDALGLHLAHAPVDVALLHLEVRDAVAEQAARLRLALEHVDVVPGTGELLGRRHPGGAGAHDRDALAGAGLRRLGLHPAHVPRPVGDRLLDRLDGDRLVLEVQRAGLLAGRGADAAGKLREIVRGVEVAGRLLPIRLEHEVVPVRDLVVDRAARRPVAERDAAIHAAGGLFRQVVLIERQRELAEVPDPVGSELVLLLLPVELEEACDLAHWSAPGPASL